eukprot:TRINITY_DN3622_c0_g1_i1.p1 TRINITY_DN3622_c0_g1~~TRINITY_DN3622_c0_g1_i1.p1  ORF type:complete len:853 (-),score=170.83 TRINITY_DN3622_c0_g1_i1:547-3105(-)
MTLKFGTKAENLAAAAPLLNNVCVPSFFSLPYAVWKDPENRSMLIAAFEKELPQFADFVAVRSSCRKEDTDESSMAGAFLSITNIPSADVNQAVDAIDKVFASFGTPADEDQVLFQRYISRASICGTMLTADLESLSPYYQLSYDRTGHTSAVTSGMDGNDECVDVVFVTRVRDAPIPPKDPRHARIYKMADELERLFASVHLDIEFAMELVNQTSTEINRRERPKAIFDLINTFGMESHWEEFIGRANERDTEAANTGEVLYLFQVRPIAHTARVLKPISKEKLNYYHKKTFEKVKNIMHQGHIDLAGKGTVFGVMPDWNPAEIIGVKPRPLSLSLYRELITDSIWASQRDLYGYRNMESFPLMITFLGHPYVDSRVSFNSFIPKDVPRPLADKLVSYYLDQLRRYPANHDKVEFKIAFTCYYPTLPTELKALSQHGFDEGEIDQIRKSLLEQTNGLLDNNRKLIEEELQKIEYLKCRHSDIMNSQMHIVQKIYFLIEDCKRYGTKPFAGLARAAFISRQMLRSLTQSGVLTTEDVDNFMCSLHTVSKKLADDNEKLKIGLISKEEFLSSYGHLRPGTYDICSFRYDEDFEGYFGSSSAQETSTERKGTASTEEFLFEFDCQKLTAIDEALKESGVRVDAKSLVKFFKESIEGREYSKFVFSKSLSDILVLVQELGRPYSLCREELSYVDIGIIKNLYASIEHTDLSIIMKESIERGLESHQITLPLQFPQLIFDPADIYEFQHSKSEPNYVTQKRVRGAVVLETSDMKSMQLEGMIPFVQSADPGWDWLFARKISGLVTMYGGLNSHMAIRAAELGLPAIIGCGPVNYAAWKTARYLEIDCSSRIVRILG